MSLAPGPGSLVGWLKVNDLVAAQMAGPPPPLMCDVKWHGPWWADKWRLIRNDSNTVTCELYVTSSSDVYLSYLFLAVCVCVCSSAMHTFLSVSQGLYLGCVSTNINDSAVACAMTSAQNYSDADHGKKMSQNRKRGNRGIIRISALFFSAQL